MTLNSIRQELLSSFSAKPIAKKSKGVEEPRPPPRRGLTQGRTYKLTLAMKQVEQRFGTRVEYLLSPELSAKEISDRLGISKATVSRWRFRVGIEVK